VILKLLPALVLLSTPALAQGVAGEAEDTVAGIWDADSLSGDWGSWRDRFAGEGLTLAADSIDEMVGNASGGTRSALIYDGRFELVGTIDLKELLDWAARGGR
jgi:carbohydrate-selective porin OprB